MSKVLPTVGTLIEIKVGADRHVTATPLIALFECVKVDKKTDEYVFKLLSVDRREEHGQRKN